VWRYRGCCQACAYIFAPADSRLAVTHNNRFEGGGGGNRPSGCFLAHGCFDVDAEQLYTICIERIPQLIETVHQMIKDIKDGTA